ncbi:MAG: HAMP domain-containing histidine kinase [Candidatus Wildermuthbacteria bacterium]|nr:HAMP domain-containing histidine kinase [Candidatus Wildermuthbacteria bacterium]
MGAHSIFSELNIMGSCRKYGLPLWQCPHFLFVMMGFVIMGSVLLSYALAARFVDPQVAALFTLILAGALLTIAFVITESFQRLADASQLKSEFVSIVSHQLKSPISNLKWAEEVMMSGRAGVPQQDQLPYFQILKENIGRMHDLVQDLLTVSKISQGTLPVAKQEFSFKELVKDIVSEFGAWMKASNAKVSLEEDEKAQKIKTDSALLRHIIQVLLENAIRYGKDEIHIMYSRQNGKLRFEVRDNGLGIPKEDQPRIFQKFFRSANAAKLQTEGSGLGLYIAKSMVEKLGGKIGFSSKENKGSAFWFVIPIT